MEGEESWAVKVGGGETRVEVDGLCLRENGRRILEKENRWEASPEESAEESGGKEEGLVEVV